VAPDPIAADCRLTYRAAHDSGHRGLSEVRLIVMHDTEGGSAESVARYFSTGAATGSAHLVVECTKAFGGTHTDPGRLWPRTFFMGRVRSYYFALVNASV
jgi:hypothetical protein